MSKNYKKIKKYYDMGLYTDAMVANFVVKGQITAEEYELITGNPYEAQFVKDYIFRSNSPKIFASFIEFFSSFKMN